MLITRAQWIISWMDDYNNFTYDLFKVGNFFFYFSSAVVCSLVHVIVYTFTVTHCLKKKKNTKVFIDSPFTNL